MILNELVENFNRIAVECDLHRGKRVVALEAVKVSIPYRTDSGESEQNDEFEGQSPNLARLNLDL